MNKQLSAHFKKSEFACRCGCGFDTVSPDLIPVLEDLRSHFSQPVIINCGCRCPEHNKAVGGAQKSQHMNGLAADVRVQNRTPALVADYLEHKYPDRYGVGRYSGFTHTALKGIQGQLQALQAAVQALLQPAAVPVADHILHEAGFESRTEQEVNAAEQVRISVAQQQQAEEEQVVQQQQAEQLQAEQQRQQELQAREQQGAQIADQQAIKKADEAKTISNQLKEM
jgi:hypothetical protein